jgi:hypothetical protein
MPANRDAQQPRITRDNSYQSPLLLTYRTRRQPVMAGLEPAILARWLLTGSASFASSVRVATAGTSPGTSPAMTSWRVNQFGGWYQMQ